MWLRALLALSTLTCAWALYSKGDAVLQLTDATFDDAVTKAEGVAMVEFYAPWCGHCKELAPHYKTVAQKLKGIVTMAAVDCDDSANKKTCSRNAIRSFPTVKLFGTDRKKNPYTKELYKEATDYQGPRTAKGLMDAATGLLSDAHITRLTTVEEFEAFTLNKPEVAKVFLFTSKKETPIMYKGLSMQLHRGLNFAEVQQDASDLVAMHEVVDFPTLIVSKPDGSSEVYSGELKAPQVAQFLSAFSSAPTKGGAAAGDAGEDSTSGAGESGKKLVEPKGPEIQNLTLEEATELDELEDMWLLGLYSPSEDEVCAASAAEFTKAVNDMQGVVRSALVAVKQEETDTASRYGVSASKLRSQPCGLQVVLLPFGSDKADLEDYSVYPGPLEGKALQKWVTDAMPTTFTSEVTAATFQYFATEAPPGSGKKGPQTISPTNPIVRILLFTNKDEVPGVFKALATNFRASFGFGWVQSTVGMNKELMQQFSVTKVPSIVFIAYIPDATPKDDGTMALRPQVGTYRGAMKYNHMAAFMETLSEVFAGPKPEEPEARIARLLPEVTDDEGLEQRCTSKGGICVLCLLDPTAGDKHERVRTMLAELAARREGQPLHFVWLDGRRFKRVASAFRLLPSDLPSVVALSAKRMRYATTAAAADADAALGIHEFLDGVLGGKIRTEVLSEIPSVEEGGAPDPEQPAGGSAGDGAGAAAPEEPVEEEFDLSDILSEEVEGGELGSKGDRLKQVDEELKAEEEARKAAAASKKKTAKKSKKTKKSSKAKSEL